MQITTKKHAGYTFEKRVGRRVTNYRVNGEKVTAAEYANLMIHAIISDKQAKVWEGRKV